MKRAPAQKFILCIILVLIGVLRRAGAQDMVIYQDSLQSGWQNFGWATLNYANHDPVHDGTSSICVTDTSTGDKALYLAHSPFNSSPYQSLSFWIYPTVSGSNELQVRAVLAGKPRQSHPLSFSPDQAGHWQHITIPLAALGVASSRTFSGFWIQNTTGKPITFDVDTITLIAVPPPNPVELTVNAQTSIRTVDPRMYGINLAIWDRLLDHPPTSDILAQLGEGAVRFPGGSGSDNYDWHTNRNSWHPTFLSANDVTTFARITEAQKSQPFITVNYGSGTPEEAAAWVAYYNGDPSSTVPLGVDARKIDWRTAGFWASLRGAAPDPLAKDDGFNFLRVSHPLPYGFKDWEIGNECYGGWEFDQHGTPGSGLTGAPHDPYTYAQAFAAFYKKMLAVDPAIHIGAVALPGEDAAGIHTHPVPNPNAGGALHTGWTPVLLATLKSQGVTPHFLINHNYPQNPGQEDDAGLLQAGAQLQADAAGLRGMLRDYLGAAGSSVELDLTELNSVTSNPGKQSTSLVDGLFMADAIGNVAQTEFNACTWWALRNSTTFANNNSLLYGWRQFGDYGIVSSGGPGTPPNTLFPTYYAAKLLTHWARGGDAIVKATSNYPLLSIFAARTAKGALVLLVVNKHPTADLNARIAFNGFVPAAGNSVIYSYGKPNDLKSTDITTGTIPFSGSSIEYTFPSYSMNVLEFNTVSTK